jgi:hypothetical protein
LNSFNVLLKEENEALENLIHCGMKKGKGLKRLKNQSGRNPPSSRIPAHQPLPL